MKLKKSFLIAILILFLFSISFSFANEDNTNLLKDSSNENMINAENPIETLKEEITEDLVNGDNPRETLNADNSKEISQSENNDIISNVNNGETTLSESSNNIKTILSDSSDNTGTTLSNKSDNATDSLSNSSSKIEYIKMGKITKRYNGAIEYQATFYDLNGKPLKNQEVYFYIDDGFSEYATTNSNGVAKVKLEVSSGKHKLTAHNYETNTEKTVQINVFKVITGNKKIVTYYEKAKYYKVRIIGENGKHVKAGQKVKFKIDGKTYIRKTNKYGYAKLKIKQAPGFYEISAKYKNYKVANIVKVKGVLKALTSFDKYYTYSFKYKVKLLTKKNKNKKITLKFHYTGNEKTKKTYKAKTNKKGIATFILKMPKKPWKGYYIDINYKKSKIGTTLASRIYNGRLHFTLYKAVEKLKNEKAYRDPNISIGDLF
jgi:hypothetical protein